MIRMNHVTHIHIEHNGQRADVLTTENNQSPYSQFAPNLNITGMHDSSTDETAALAGLTCRR